MTSMENTDYKFHNLFNDSYSSYAKRMMRFLSENSRISIMQLSKELHLSNKTAKLKLKRLEEAFNIKYTLELDFHRLGLPTPFISVLDFKKKPDYEYLTQLLLKSHIPQFAFSVKDKNRVYVCCAPASLNDFAYWGTTMATLFAKDGLECHSSQITHNKLGFIPVRRKLLEKLDIDVQTRTLLAVINDDSRIPIQKLSESLGASTKKIGYMLDRLIKNGVIRRFTIVASSPKNTIQVAMRLNISPKENIETVAPAIRKIWKSDEEWPISNRYPLISSLIGEWSTFILGTYDNYAAAKTRSIDLLRRTYGAHLEYINIDIVDKILMGRLPIRSIEPSTNYTTLNWNPDTERM